MKILNSRKSKRKYRPKSIRASLEDAFETIVYSGLVTSAFLICAGIYAYFPNSVLFYIAAAAMLITFIYLFVPPHLLSKEAVPKKAKPTVISGNRELLSELAPGRIEIRKDHVKVNNTYLRTFYVESYPEDLQDGWLTPLIATRSKINLSMHVFPADGEYLVSQYNLEIAKVDSLLMRLPEGDPREVRASNYSEALKRIRDALDLGTTKPFKLALYITVKASNKKELDASTQLLLRYLKARKIKLAVPVLKMDRALRSVLPLCEDSLQKNRLFDTYSLKTTFPYIQNTFSMQGGVHIGYTPDYQPLLFSRWDMRAPHVAIIAPTRSGKSYFLKCELWKEYLYHPKLRVFIVDPTRLPDSTLSEFTPLTLKVGGQIIKFGVGGEKPPVINPFDIRTVSSQAEQPLTEKMQKVSGFINTIFELTKHERAVLESVLPEVYRKKGITNNTNIPTFNGLSPTFSDLQQELREFSRSENASQQDKAICDKLARLLHPWVNSQFNAQSNIELKARWILFDITAVRNTPMFEPAAYLIMDFIDGQVKETRDPKLVVFDEDHLILQSKPIRTFQQMMSREYAKYRAGLTVASQLTEDYLSTEEGRAILDNCPTAFLLHHDSISKQMQDYFNLNQLEREVILKAETGRRGYSEALLIAESAKTKLLIESYGFEHPVITSSPEELKLMEEEIYGRY